MRCSQDAVAAIEFGLLAPVMAIMVFGVFELARAAIIWEQVRSSARVIAESASTLAIQTDSSAQLTPAQVNQALSAIFAEIPGLRGILTGGSPPGSAYAVLTSVNYAPDTTTGCTSNCPYVATVEWSKAYGYPGFLTPKNAALYAPLRPCVQLSQFRVGQKLDASSIPTADVKTTLEGFSSSSQNQAVAAVPDAFLIADVQVNYTLSLPSWLTFFSNGKVSFSASSYVPVRSNKPTDTNIWATLTAPSDPTDVNNDSPAECCPSDPC